MQHAPDDTALPGTIAIEAQLSCTKNFLHSDRHGSAGNDCDVAADRHRPIATDQVLIHIAHHPSAATYPTLIDSLSHSRKLIDGSHGQNQRRRSPGRLTLANDR